jgi:glycosyltransferase involved in cell wall biosynthesis
MPEEQLPILYNMSNCFILPSRGEGFGLPYIEAGACEIPVIATRCGGQMDFLTDDNSYLIDIEGFNIGNQEIRSISSYYENVPFAVLGQKTVTQLRETMRHVVNNYSEAKNKASKLKDNVIQNYTWDHLVEKVYQRLIN